MIYGLQYLESKVELALRILTASWHLSPLALSILTLNIMKKRTNKVMLSLTDDEHSIACKVAGAHRMPVAKFLRIAFFHKEFCDYSSLSESNEASVDLCQQLARIKTLKPTPELVSHVMRMERHMERIANSLGEPCYIESEKIRKRLKEKPNYTLGGAD